MPARFTLLSIILAMLVSPSLRAQQERIVCRADPKAGEVSIQLQNVRNGIETLSVDVVDIRTRKVIDTLTSKDFEKTDLKHVFKAIWKPGPGSGLFAMIVRSKDKATPASKSATPYGKINFDGQFQSKRATLEFGKKLFQWNLRKPAIMRGLVMMKSGLPVARPLDWHLAPVGRGSVPWDFVGDDGLPYEQHPDLVPQVQTVPIPAHWIVWGDIDWSGMKSLPEFANLDLPGRRLGFSLKALGEGAEKTDGIWRMDFRPGTGLRLELDEATHAALAGKRFEILLYLHGQFIHEESQGVNPYTYALPSNLKGQGSQYLTVTIVDYAGNWGTRTIILNFGDGAADGKKRQAD